MYQHKMVHTHKGQANILFDNLFDKMNIQYQKNENVWDQSKDPKTQSLILKYKLFFFDKISLIALN